MKKHFLFTRRSLFPRHSLFTRRSFGVGGSVGGSVSLSALLLCCALSTLSAQKWTPVSVGLLPANFDFWSISVVSADVMWAVGDSFYNLDVAPPTKTRPIVLRTVDGGNTWDYRTVNQAVGRFAFDIVGLDANTAIFTTNKFINADTRPVFKTTDGGLTWKTITPPNFAGGVFIHFFDAKNGLVVNRTLMATTANGGDTWTAVPAANIPTLLSDEFHVLSSASNHNAQVGDRIWIGTTKGRVMRTLDRGLHWTIAQATTPSENIETIAFTDSLNGVAATSGLNFSKLRTTSDGGQTWTPLASAPMGEITVLSAVPGAANHYFAGSSLLSADAKQPYVALNTNGLAAGNWGPVLIDSFYLRGAKFLSPTVGYAVGWSGKKADIVIINGQEWNRNYIWKWTGSVPAGEPLEPGSVNISPNPTAGIFSVDLHQVISAQSVTVKIMDSMGREVASQIDPVSQASIQFDLSHLPAGLYIAQVLADGKVVAVNKVQVLR